MAFATTNYTWSIKRVPTIDKISSRYAKATLRGSVRANLNQRGDVHRHQPKAQEEEAEQGSRQGQAIATSTCF